MSTKMKWTLFMAVLAILNWYFFGLDVYHKEVDWTSYLSLSAALLCSYAAVIWWGDETE